MPITIGSQTDVPSTGDPIVSPWYQDTSRKLVHTFATGAARDAWTSRPEGAVAYTAADDTLATWNGAAWIPYATLAAASAGDGTRVAKAGDTMTGNLTMIQSPHTDVAGGVLQRGIFWSTVAPPDATAEPNLYLNRTGPSAGQPAAIGGVYARFARGWATTIGTITVASGGAAVVYNTTSDPRTKTTAAARGIDDAAERAAALGRQAWRGQYLDSETGEANGDDWDFLSSHDIEEHAAYAVTGERDAVDDDGHPIYQQVNYPALVPLLFAAIADLTDRVAALEAAA